VAVVVAEVLQPSLAQSAAGGGSRAASSSAARREYRSANNEIAETRQFLVGDLLQDDGALEGLDFLEGGGFAHDGSPLPCRYPTAAAPDGRDALFRRRPPPAFALRRP